METCKQVDQCMEWPELAEMFGMSSEEDHVEEEKRRILERMNRLADRYGKDYVAKRIALHV